MLAREPTPSAPLPSAPFADSPGLGGIERPARQREQTLYDPSLHLINSQPKSEALASHKRVRART